jgi:hypothetical protein
MAGYSVIIGPGVCDLHRFWKGTSLRIQTTVSGHLGGIVPRKTTSPVVYEKSISAEAMTRLEDVQQQLYRKPIYSSYFVISM